MRIVKRTQVSGATDYYIVTSQVTYAYITMIDRLIIFTRFTSSEVGLEHLDGMMGTTVRNCSCSRRDERVCFCPPWSSPRAVEARESKTRGRVGAGAGALPAALLQVHLVRASQSSYI